MKNELNKVSVFTSAPFREMMEEREILINYVFPYLRELSNNHRIELIDIDLRWGITEEMGHERILEIIKSELNRASIMISILGNGFGWIPPGEYDSTLALEMYTALASPAMKLLVFQCSPFFKDQITEKELPCNQLKSREIELEQMKLIRRIQHLGVPIITYDSLDDFKSKALSHLHKVLEETYYGKIGNVFISYSRKDIEVAERIRHILEGFRFNVWLDLVGIAAGEEWPKKLTEAIIECDVVLLLISQASVLSEYCLKEILFAKKKNKPIVALRLDSFSLPDKIEFMVGDIQQIQVPEDHNLELIISDITNGLKQQIKLSKPII